ncbi:MAG: hypothetical protein V5A55_01815 [Halovenus sp.]
MQRPKGRQNDERDRYAPFDREEEENGPGPLVDNQDNLRRSAVQETAQPILDRWGQGTAFARVRSRLQKLLSAGLVIIAVQLLFDPGGLTGLLLALWFLVSVPVVVLTAAVLVTLRNPTRAADVWWDSGMVATAGLVAISGFARVGKRTAIGRVGWQLLFDEDGPEGEGIIEDSAIDLETVARIRRYLRYVIVGSAVLVVADQLLRRGTGLSGVSGPAEWTAVAVGLGVVGFVLGLFAAVYRG